MARRANVEQVAARGYWRESEARTIVDAWRRSGETVTGFAQRHGFEPRRLARWVGRLDGAADEPVRFHPVQLVERRPESEDTGSGGWIEIELADGHRVRVPRGFEADELRRVLAVLGEAARC